MKTLIVLSILLVSNIAFADQTYTRETDFQPLAGPAKICVGDWAKALWPVIVKANIQTVSCQRNHNVNCGAWEERTTTIATMTALGSGRVVQTEEDNCGVRDVGGGNATYCYIYGPTRLTLTQRQDLRACLNLIWPGVDTSTIYQLDMKKLGPGNVIAQYKYYTTDTDTNWLADFLNKVATWPQ